MKKFLSAVTLSAVMLSSLSLSACDNQPAPVQQSSDVQSSMESSVVSSVPESSLESSQPSLVSKNPIQESQITQMNDNISSYQNMPTFEVTSDSINAKSVAKDKTITLIADNLNRSYTKLVTEQFKVAANAVGFAKVIISKTDGSSSSIDNALNTAVNDKSDIIIMFGDINKDNFSSNIEYAQANGIEVISAGCISSGQNDHFADYTMPVNYQLIGQTLADWAIVNTKGNLNVLAVNCTDSVTSNTIAAGFKKQFDNYIADATGYCTGVNAVSAEIGGTLSNKIQQALKKDDKLNYVVVFDETMIDDAVSAVSQLSKKIPVIATGGSDEPFTSARNNELEMLVAQSYEWTAYGMVDYALRILGNASLPDEQYVPFRVLTSESIATEIYNFGGLSGNFNRICFGSYFEYGYDSLWQL